MDLTGRCKIVKFLLGGMVREVSMTNHYGCSFAGGTSAFPAVTRIDRDA